MTASERPPRSRSSRWLHVAAAVLPGPGLGLAVWFAAADRHDALLAVLLYAAMPPALLAAVLAGAYRLRRSATPPATWLARTWPGLLLAVLTTFGVAAAVPSRMRVQFDETSLVGVSQNMHRQHLAVMTTGAEPYQGQCVPVENTVDKRPPLFPFLVSLLHGVRGERLDNAYLLNLLLLALAQGIVFAAVRARAGLAAALAAPLLLLAVPLTTVVATSAGFELLAAVLFLLAVLAAHDCAERDDLAARAWFAAVGVLFAATRYEALPALLLLVALVAWRRRGRRAPAPRGALVVWALASLLATPLLLLLLHARQPKFYPEAGGRPLVAFAHFAEHAGPFVTQWFAPALANPLPGVLAMLAAVAAVLAWRAGPGRAGSALVLAPVLAVTAATLAWFVGDVREAIALRLFLPAAWATALAPLWLVARFGARAGWPLLAVAAVLAPLRTATVARDEALPPTAAARVTAAIDALVAAQAPDPATTLWIGTPAQHLVVLGHAALCPGSFLQRAAGIQALRRQGDVRTIYVLTTPLDAALAGGMGDPARVLQLCPHDLVVRAGRDGELALYRLR